MIIRSAKERAAEVSHPFPTYTIKQLKQIQRLNEKGIFIIPKAVGRVPFNYPPSVVVGISSSKGQRVLNDKEYAGRAEHAEMWRFIKDKYLETYEKVFGT